MNVSVVIRSALLVGVFSFLALPQSQGQQVLDEDFANAMSQINQRSVTATISFLASDEMAGRDTPSPELTMASAYVASRFRGAGLKPGGDETSYYQNTEVATVANPNDGVSFSVSGTPVETLGLLVAGDELIKFEGDIPVVDLEELGDQEFRGPVSVISPPLTNIREDFRTLQKLTRAMNSLRSRGATAVLLQVDKNNLLVSQAANTHRPSLINPRMRTRVPTLLIPSVDDLSDVKLVLPQQQHGTATVSNVIGVLPGSDPELANEAIIFSAHLDHIGIRLGQKDTICNGADDDATGVTAVLTLADAFGRLKVAPKRTLIFMTFWGEEKGLLGSKYYADHPTWPLKKTVANINIEMIGRPEGGAHEKMWMTGWDKSNLGTVMAEGAKSVGIEVFEHPRFSQMLYGASDNASFVRKGVVGHSFSAGSLHDDYHQVTDHWEKLDLRHMTRVIQGLFAGSLPIANSETDTIKAK